VLVADEAKPFVTLDELRIEDISAVWSGVDRDAIGRVLSAGSPHLMVGRDEKFFRHSS